MVNPPLSSASRPPTAALGYGEKAKGFQFKYCSVSRKIMDNLGKHVFLNYGAAMTLTLGAEVSFSPKRLWAAIGLPLLFLRASVGPRDRPSVGSAGNWASARRGCGGCGHRSKSGAVSWGRGFTPRRRKKRWITIDSSLRGGTYIFKSMRPKWTAPSDQLWR